METVINNLPVAIDDINQDNAPQIYKRGGLDVYFDYVKSQVEPEIPDLTTKKGRERIASQAAKISRSKTAIDKPGRDFLRKIKELPKEIEQELKKFTDNMDELRDEIRRPLTEWEESEVARIKRHDDALTVIRNSGDSVNSSSGEYLEILKKVESLIIEPGICQEFLVQYVEAKSAAIKKLTDKYSAAVKDEHDRADLERLRAEQVQRDLEKRDQEIAREAAEREKQAAAERESKLKRDAEQAEQRLKAEKLAAEARAKEDAKNAEADKARAVENERLRIETEQKRAQAIADKQAANKAHQKNVNNEILEILKGFGVNEETAKKIIVAAAVGQAGKLTINY